jgi:starch synthase
MSGVEVLAVASEFYPLIKTGGLADVAGALPGALAAEGVKVRTLLPGYPQVLAVVAAAEPVHAYRDLFGGPARVLAATTGGADLFLLDAPHLFAREGGPYVDAAGRDWPDNARRFAALGRAGADLAQGRLAAYAPDIVHAHDWQAGLTAAYLHYDRRERPGTVFTVHNLAFQGQFDANLLASLGLPARAFDRDGIEYYGGIGYLKAGLRLSDRLTTVSPTYAAEICTAESGMGLEGLLRGRADRLTGILNGIDTTVWDPDADPLIAERYSRLALGSRRACRADLRRRFGLTPHLEAPLFGVVSRLSWQKGLDLLLEALPALIAGGGQLAVLGSGDAELQAGFAQAAQTYPGRVGCLFGYDEALAHAVQAGADVIVVPSRFEPCGLTQLCALRYGALPLVARVGGLADTVIDASPMALAAGAATGFQIAPVSAPMLEHAVRKALALFRKRRAWRRLQMNGMATDVSWVGPAKAYASLYRGVIAERRAA